MTAMAVHGEEEVQVMAGPDGELTFITCLRHPETVSDWAWVETLLAATLRSLDTQSVPCRVVVVAGRAPRIPEGLRSSVEVVVVDFPAPVNLTGTHEGWLESTRLDRGSKYAVALGRVSGGYVMTVDSDDFVSRRVGAYVRENAGGPGWYVENGYRYDRHTGLLRRQGNFNGVCGSSLVFRRDLLADPVLPAEAGLDQVVAAWGERTVTSLLGSHRHLRAELGLPALPFPGAVYQVNTGENVSGSSGLSFGRPTSRALAHEFGLVRRPACSMWWAAGRKACPAALRAARRVLRGAFPARRPTGRR